MQMKTEEFSEFSHNYHPASKLLSCPVLFRLDPYPHPSPLYYFEANPRHLKDKHIAIIIPKAIRNNALPRIHCF